MGKRKAVEEGGGSGSGSGSGSVAGGGKGSSSSGIIEATNALTENEFVGTYWKVDDCDLLDGQCQAEMFYAHHMGVEKLQTCFDLIEKTSRHDYEPSSFGWHPKRKLREMKEKEMRYILIGDVHVDVDAHLVNIKGFLSFMLTHDSVPSVPVLYVYELHLNESSRGKGLGKELMRIAEGLARRVGVEKVMLTCFKSNEKARKFYESLGYAVDVSSPEDRTTRKKVVKVDYMIMSKEIKTAAAETEVVSAVGDAVLTGMKQVAKEFREVESYKHNAQLLTSDKLIEWCRGASLTTPYEKLLADIFETDYYEEGLLAITRACRKYIEAAHGLV